MKRRSSSSSRTLPTLSQYHRPSQEPATTTVADPIDTISQTPGLGDDTAKAGPQPTMAPIIPTNEPLTGLDADIDVDEDPADDVDATTLPTFSTRTAITDERARGLFAKYNLKYDPRGKRPQQEPPNKIRRVEKPVRLRVHWTCHECRMQFGLEKVCAGCGHRRCRDCVRHPPKRAREALEFNTLPMEEEEVQVQDEAEGPPPDGEDSATVDPDLLSYRGEPAAPPLSPEDASPNGTPRTSAPAATAGEPLTSPPLEIDDDAEVDYAHLRSSQYMIHTRPRAAIHSILQPTKNPTRRTCHECNATLRHSGAQDCPSCGHVQCDLCAPSTEHQLQKPGPSNQEPEEEASMVRSVKRVYRKPRQRVRYRCENCNAHFVESDRCVECGHERCHACHREP